MKTFTVVQNDAPKIVFETEANTVGELRTALAEHGVDCYGKAIFEGLTRLELTNANDDTVLPHDVNYRGNTTNNLVFMVTAAKKKIASGIDRKELYAKIKEMNLAEAIKEHFGKNFTQVTTEALTAFVLGADGDDTDDKEFDETSTDVFDNLRDAFAALVRMVKSAGITPMILDILVEEGILMSTDNIDDTKEESKELYSDADIAEMFN